MEKINVLSLAIDLIAKLESFQNKAYKDEKGVITIGFGTTLMDGRKVTLFDVCSLEQAKLWLKTRIEEDYNKLESFCRMHDISLENNQAAVILSFSYNAGWTGFLSSSMARDFIIEKTEKVTTDLLKWNKIRMDGNLVFSAGLFNRRMQEAQCFIDERKCL